VKQTVVFGPIRNSHLEPIAGCMSAVAPKLPIAAPAINVHNPLAQQEMDLDALTYSGKATSSFELQRIGFWHVKINISFCVSYLGCYW